MIIDKETNLVYFSKTLKQEEYSAFLKILLDILKTNNIEYDFLSYTNDIWCRDYMPIQVSKDKFVQFKYDPIYSPITNATETCKDIGIKPVISDIKLDGGNIEKSKTKVIMTERVIADNRRHYPDYKDLVKELEDLLEVEQIIIIPEHPDDIFGHADGIVRFLDGVDNEKDVLVNDSSKESPDFKEKLYRALKEGGLNSLPEIPYNPYGNKENLDASGVYINYLQVGKIVIYPTYEIKEDAQAHKVFFKYFGTQVFPIRANAIAKNGGVLNCISWNIRK